MRKSALMGVAALALASAPLTASPVMAANPAPATLNPTVAVGVSATEEAAPDIGIINAGLETRQPTSQAAMDENSKDFAKIMAVVKKYKIAAKDMQTAGVSVRQEFDYTDDGGRQPKGYIATNTLSITMRDLKSVGALMTDLVAAGANAISGPSFGLDDSEFLTDRAREKAFDSAQRRALAYARKAGFKSVKLLTINEGAGDMAYAYGADAAAAGAAAAAEGTVFALNQAIAAPIEPGQVVQTVYANFLFEMMP